MRRTWKLWGHRMLQTECRKEKRIVLGISEFAVAEAPAEIVCYGLGSCIGIFLYDKFQKIGAGAHIMLPGDGDQHESNKMINSIITEMVTKGCNLLTIRARITGGADIMNMKNYQIGRRNIEFVKRELKNKGIMILAEDVGGTLSRTAILKVGTGELYINAAQQKTIKQ